MRLRIPGRKVTLRSLRWMRARVRRHFLVLGYHRICARTGAHDPLAVTPRNFAEQMAVLAGLARVISLRSACARLASGDVPARAVVITFDDGYADNLHEALPVLERYELAATFFVVSDYLGREFWWDRLERLTPSANGARDGADGKLREMMLMSDTDRTEALDRVALTVDARPATPVHRALATDELLRLAGSPCIDIGAHTATHAPLGWLPIENQRREIEAGRDRLQAILSRPVRTLSYPHGAISPATIGLVRHAGFEAACCSRPDVVSGNSDRFAVPRFWIRDWDGGEFHAFLRRWGAA